MIEDNTRLLDDFENLLVYYTSDDDIPTDVLEEIMYNIQTELRERDQEEEA